MRQRELGLQQLAGTADMAVDGHPSTFTPGPGARGTVTLVMTCNTYPTCTYNNNKDIWYCNAAVTVCQELGPVFRFARHLQLACASPCLCTTASVPEVSLKHDAVYHTCSK